MVNERFYEQLKRHEGLCLKAYRCSAGKLTIGYGHNLESKPLAGIDGNSEISAMEAERILKADVEGFCRELDVAMPWWRELDEVRQGVLLNMAFNMGVGRLMGFRRMLAAVRAGDWLRAGNEMLDSKWKWDVKGRAFELARQMETGEWM